ncbi:uncharacterized protein C8A04DRAFT_32388 [Dichotomopilus funicola]|uniref:Zn(2)-C6 fungal-type domain-containing protein n=1 Tax=Dichotomopilus funicola TaxID=1934379 RepID=A0AAN6UYA3_9PEZI|nr:hypothetical protein C8A04DRAFT_32388 [Dichotomopilus funicola]
MGFDGTPSKGCQTCRTRRVKCDETKPTCKQCAKARRDCPGYRDDFDIVLRNENHAARRRALNLGGARKAGGGSGGRKAGKRAAAAAASSSTSDVSSPSSSRATTTTITSTTTAPRQHRLLLARQSQTAAALSPSPLHIPPESLAPSHFFANFVLVPGPDGSRGFLDYLLPLLNHSSSTTPTATTNAPPLGLDGKGGAGGKGKGDEHLVRAFNACALASWGNRMACVSPSSPSSASSSTSSSSSSSSGAGVAGPGPLGLGGVVLGKQRAGGILGKAFGEYSQALRATQAALVDPVRWKDDSVLAAVLLLGMFENITAKQIGSLAWGSHTEGAIQLVKARGRAQLKTKVGLQLFIAVRTQLIVHALSTGIAPPMGTDWWMRDAVIDPTGSACQRLCLEAGEVRSTATRLMTGITRTPDNIRRAQDLVRRSYQLDQAMTHWMASVPESWRARTLCWQYSDPSSVSSDGKDYSLAEVFPGRVDLYPDIWVAGLWNQLRAARLALMSIIVRTLAWVNFPGDYRTMPQFASAARLCIDIIADILASVPCCLGWHLKRKDLWPQDMPVGVAGGDGSVSKGLAGYFLAFPLACVLTQDYTTDAQRTYIRGRLRHIGDVLGVKYAHILCLLQFRVPSMLMWSDVKNAASGVAAANFEKVVSSPRQAYPTPEPHTPPDE